MIRVARHDKAQRGKNFFGLGLGRAVARPVIPGHRIHERLGEEHLSVEVIGIVFAQLAHCPGKRLVEGAIGRLDDPPGNVSRAR